MKKLQFEKIGDINSDFPYLAVYLIGTADPIMEIGIDDANEIKFVIYPSSKNSYILNLLDWNEILRVAEEFLPRALEDERYEREQEALQKRTPETDCLDT